MENKIARDDPNLKKYAGEFEKRKQRLAEKKARLLQPGQTLSDFANGHEYFGFHKTESGWFYREWAPGADQLYLTGDFCGWERHAHPMQRLENGVFELFLSGTDTLRDGMRVMLLVVRGDKELERIPLYATRVIQEPDTFQWNGVIYDPEAPFLWTDKRFVPKKSLYIYECHIGMAQEEGKVGSYREFAEVVLPRIHALGYTAIQIMAVMEHPYYASFGYQVTNFFAASSRFGRPEDLKNLIDRAHKLGIAVLLDVVHSHANSNTREGINEFDGTSYQFFHDGAKGNHPAWGTKCFDYDKNEVLHFLLSNLKYWQTEYHFDGFRFDGVTSMLYFDHGLGTAFTSNDQYFSMNTDVDAITYLQLANELVRQVNPHAITIAEDTSAIPGLSRAIEDGGIGFDYRLAMGEPDMWIRLLKESKDEDWDLNHIYYELANRRPGEPVIGYCESHDQALVGDKTLMFRMCDAKMYTCMDKGNEDAVVARAMALHKMIRLLTMTLGGEGYLTFMGNEFGHPEWIDFPREGNGWSHHYCRRQWSLADNPDLKYGFLQAFDQAMVALSKKHRVLGSRDKQLLVQNGDKVMVYKKGGAVFAYNFDPTRSYEGYFLPMPQAGTYDVIFSTDDFCFGGYGRVYHQSYTTEKLPDGRVGIRMYLPCRTAAVLKKQ